jgi:hypothetical protein
MREAVCTSSVVRSGAIDLHKLAALAAFFFSGGAVRYRPKYFSVDYEHVQNGQSDLN